MKKLLTAALATVIVSALALAMSASSPTTYAQEDDSQAAESGEVSSTNSESYTFVAQPGDSYSQMARKAVQIYGIETDTQIGRAGVLFAETNITSLAGWPLLNEGESVTINKSDVREWVEKAAELTAEEKANWEYYVPFVDFNTNAVGETARG